MFTLRIIMTGLIAFGPMADEPHLNEEVWAIMAEAPDHITRLLFGCDGNGENCGTVKDIAGLDLRLAVDGNLLEQKTDSFFYVDHPYMHFMADVAEITGTANPQLKAGLASHMASGNPMDLSLRNLIAGRLHLVPGLAAMTDCDPVVKACSGSLSAHLADPCKSWKFDSNVRPMASRVVYELRVDALEIKVRAYEHDTGNERKSGGFPLTLRPSLGEKVVEIWVANYNPGDMQTTLPEFANLYDLFLPLGSGPIPEYIDSGKCPTTGGPGLNPQICPGVRF